MNLWKSTMFFCHFWWGHKQAAFEVFSKEITERYCGEDRSCVWKATPNGIILVGDMAYDHFYPWR
ncbi:hypothetical protein PHJA_001863700 [Phtheirospermum japonicum]|uniref:S-protein homolog n=1 Tax=Phtheirospermum japonicum TaxID=374723 RepID=A0A830CDD9_9LAMI|nr:hypothetical protein PHJA_001863700 [Phtheirospermum japonicum]